MFFPPQMLLFPDAILHIIACTQTCDLFLLYGMLWRFDKYGSVNSVRTGSIITQYAGSDQCLLEGQEEK